MSLNNLNPKSKQHAFTLIELIMVIVLLGVMAVGISGFLGLSSQTLVNISERDELLNSARFVVERLNRELRNALPNSIRIMTAADNSSQCVEFVPIKASTFYTDIPVSPELASVDLKVVKFIDQQGNNYQCGVSCADMVSVYPLTPAEVYSVASNGIGKTFQLTSFTPPNTGDEWTLKAVKPSGKSGVQFLQDSPTKRLYITDSAVSYCVASGNITRYSNYGLSVTQSLTPNSGSTALMAEKHALLSSSNLPFNYFPASLKRNAVLQVNFSFENNAENITLNQQIHLINIP